jgi:predicted transcriptional regulator
MTSRIISTTMMPCISRTQACIGTISSYDKDEFVELTNDLRSGGLHVGFSPVIKSATGLAEMKRVLIYSPGSQGDTGHVEHVSQIVNDERIGFLHSSSDALRRLLQMKGGPL